MNDDERKIFAQKFHTTHDVDAGKVVLAIQTHEDLNNGEPMVKIECSGRFTSMSIEDACLVPAKLNELLKAAGVDVEKNRKGGVRTH